MTYIEHFGNYFIMLSKTFGKPESWRVHWRLIFREINDLILSSVGIVIFISLFVGAVTAIQMFNNFQGGIIPIPDIYIGFATKQVLILEFAPTMVSIILAGKVGSYIASTIGSMRISQQIDALDVMGVNSYNCLIQPKIIACVLYNPILIIISYCIGILGGYIAGQVTGNWSSVSYINGIQLAFQSYEFIYSLIKTTVFAFLIATIPSYFGYHVKGGALNVGRAGTSAVLWTCIWIIILNLIITQLMLG